MSEASLSFDEQVRRLTPGKPAKVVEIRELSIGDIFDRDGKRLTITTHQQDVRTCVTGQRVKYQGRWRFVMRHGNEVVLLPLLDGERPFSALAKDQEGQFSSSVFPIPILHVPVICFKEVE